MSRKSALQTLTASGLFSPTPSHRISSPSLINENSSPRNPYILQDEIIPGKTPYTRRHHGKQSGLVSGSTGGGGKNGKSGGKKGTGGNQGQTDNDSDSSSSQDDEDEDDDEGDDEDEEEEPAVGGPVHVNGNDDMASVEKLSTSHSAKVMTSVVDESLQRGTHRTGSDSRKRSFSIAMEDEKIKDEDEDEDDDGDESEPNSDAENETGDESDYPRKRVATELSNTNGILAYHSAPASVATTDTNLDDLDDLDDEDVEGEEESALIQDFEANEDCSTPGVDLAVPNPIVLEYGDEDPNNPNLITAEDLEDLDNEVFGVGWGDPSAFHDIELANDFASFSDPFADIQLDYGLFPENGSEISGPEFTTPFDTPNYTPRGSFSTAVLSGPSSPDNANGSESDEDDLAELTPYFERDDPVLKHIVSTQGKGIWADDSDDEHGLWKHFFSEEEEADSNEEFEADSENASEEGDSETDEGETTDEEEDLPMPTPRSKSMLRRASISSTSSPLPQVVHVNGSSPSGPTLGIWFADPNRTICVVDGSKKTFLLPGGAKGHALGDTDKSQMVVLEESESEKSSTQMGYNPTLSGLTGGDGFFLNGSDILGPPEAFYDPIEDIFGLCGFDGDLITNDDDDGIDEYEEGLQITDFLDFSTDEADSEIQGGDSDGAYDEGEDDDECTGAAETSETMLARWDQVAVTSFRKRQIQHAQGNIHTNSPATPHKIGDRRLSQTITPARKKKLKSRYMINNKGPGSSTGAKNRANKKSGANLGVGSQWGV